MKKRGDKGIKLSGKNFSKKAQLNPVVITAEEPKIEFNLILYLFIGITIIILLFAGGVYFKVIKLGINSTPKNISENLTVKNDFNETNNISQENNSYILNNSIVVNQIKINTSVKRSSGGSGGGSHTTNTCTPDCNGKTCGDDSCGGSCAPGCLDVESCNQSGLCEKINIIIAIAEENGNISSSGSFSFHDGDNITYIITPFSGYLILDVLVDNLSVGAFNNYTFLNITSSHTISARFIPIGSTTFIINSSTGIGGTINPSGLVSVSFGSNQTFIINPNNGYIIQSVSVDGNLVGALSSYKFENISSNHTISVSSLQLNYTLNVIAVNGQVIKSPDRQSYFSGSKVNLTANANLGFIFVNWTGDVTNTSNPLSVIMNSNKTIIANFEEYVQGNYTLNIIATNGVVTKTPDKDSYATGSQVNLSATGNSGFTFLNWVGDATGSNNPLTVIMNLNKTITANFVNNTINPLASPYENTQVPANAIYWDIATFTGSNNNFKEFRILRADPGKPYYLDSSYTLIKTIPYLTNQYVDYSIDTTYAPENRYYYKIQGVNTTNNVFTYSFASPVIKINYGVKELLTENILIIASNSSDSTRGANASIMPDGTDLVTYYANKRGIPLKNIIRLNIKQGMVFNTTTFFTNLSIPIYDYLVSNNLTSKIFAITTFPGAQTYTHVYSFDGYHDVPNENVMAHYIAQMISINTTTSGDFSGGYGFNTQSYNQGNMDDVLLYTLGYTKMEAPIVEPYFTYKETAADGYLFDNLFNATQNKIVVNGVELKNLTDVIPILNDSLSTNVMLSQLTNYVWDSFMVMLNGSTLVNGTDDKKIYYRKLIISKMREVYPNETVDQILNSPNGTFLRTNHGEKIVTTINHMVDDQNLYFQIKTDKIVSSTFYNNQIIYWQKRLLNKSIMNSNGTILEPYEIKDIKWFNIALLSGEIFPSYFIAKDEHVNFLSALNSILKTVNTRKAFIGNYSLEVSSALSGSSDPVDIELKTLIDNYNKTELQTQLMVRRMLEKMYAGKMYRYDGLVLTSLENLKRIIDQTIDAEISAKNARDAGRNQTYYVHLFDSDPNDKIPNTGYDYGDLKFLSAERLLKEYGYITFINNIHSGINLYDAKEPDIKVPQDIVDGLKSKSLELKGFAGWYWPGSYDNQYYYVENFAGFGNGSYITPLDSYYDPGFKGLRKNGVVAATNSQFEPYVYGLSEISCAMTYAETPLSFTSLMATRYNNWAPNVYGDPLYNMGKYILPETSGNSTYQKHIISMGSPMRTGIYIGDGTCNYNYVRGERSGIRYAVRNEVGHVIEDSVSIGKNYYYNNSTMEFVAVNSMYSYLFDITGKIVSGTIKEVAVNGSNCSYITMRKVYLYDSNGSYTGFDYYYPNGTKKSNYNVKMSVAQSSLAMLVESIQSLSISSTNNDFYSLKELNKGKIINDDREKTYENQESSVETPVSNEDNVNLNSGSLSTIIPGFIGNIKRFFKSLSIIPRNLL